MYTGAPDLAWREASPFIVSMVADIVTAPLRPGPAPLPQHQQQTTAAAVDARKFANLTWCIVAVAMLSVAAMTLHPSAVAAAHFAVSRGPVTWITVAVYTLPMALAR